MQKQNHSKSINCVLWRSKINQIRIFGYIILQGSFNVRLCSGVADEHQAQAFNSGEEFIISIVCRKISLEIFPVVCVHKDGHGLVLQMQREFRQKGEDFEVFSVFSHGLYIFLLQGILWARLFNTDQQQKQLLQFNMAKIFHLICLNQHDMLISMEILCNVYITID